MDPIDIYPRLAEHDGRRCAGFTRRADGAAASSIVRSSHRQGLWLHAVRCRLAAMARRVRTGRVLLQHAEPLCGDCCRERCRSYNDIQPPPRRRVRQPVLLWMQASLPNSTSSFPKTLRSTSVGSRLRKQACRERWQGWPSLRPVLAGLLQRRQDNRRRRNRVAKRRRASQRRASAGTTQRYVDPWDTRVAWGRERL